MRGEGGGKVQTVIPGASFHLEFLGDMRPQLGGGILVWTKNKLESLHCKVSSWTKEQENQGLGSELKISPPALAPQAGPRGLKNVYPRACLNPSWRAPALGALGCPQSAFCTVALCCELNIDSPGVTMP